MSNRNIDRTSEKHQNISEKIESISFNSIRKVLPDKVIIDACKAVDYQFRQRMITPIITVLHMILAAIWPQESFAASWHILWASFSSMFAEQCDKSPSLGSVAKARARLPVKVWQNLFEWISERAQNLSQRFDKWHGHRVILADGTCISMSDKDELFEKFGTSAGYHGKCKYPLARLVALCIANTMMVLDYAIGSYNQSEISLIQPLLKKLRKGDLLLADRNFAAAHFYWNYKSIGLEFLTRIHQCLIISRIKRIESYGADDFLGWLTINENYRKKDPCMPAKIMVRFIKAVIRIRGHRQDVWFATSLLDNKEYPAGEVVELYARRWRIETLFRDVKINFSPDVLRSQTSAGIHKEIAARLAAVNIVRTIMLEAAIEQDVEPMRISFVYAVRAVLSFSPALATGAFLKLPQIYKAMLVEMAAHLIEERPGRNEPRLIRLEQQKYPTLRITRSQWRAKNVA